MTGHTETDEQKVRNLLNTGVEEPQLRTLDDLTTVELKLRLGIVTSVLLEARANKDERYKRLIPQQRKLNDVLVARSTHDRAARGEPVIEPVVIQCKPLKLTSRMPVKG